MLTIFAIPKDFKGQFQAIQLNAIQSWTLLEPRPEIILFGDDEGTAEVAARFGLRHVSSVERNEYGTPRVDRLFLAAQKVAGNDLLCYINSDIILTQDFISSVADVDRLLVGKPFLAVGRKTSLPIKELLDFSDPGWPEKLAGWARREGRHVTYDSDFFLFRRGHWTRLPPFAIGRCYWSSWFMWDTRHRGLPMVDMTEQVLSVEPRHDYSHALSTGGHARLSGVEFKNNWRLFKGCHYYTTVNSTKLLRGSELVDPPFKNRGLDLAVRFEYWLYFLLKGRLYPYSLPAIVAARLALALVRWLRSIPRHLARRQAPTSA